MPIELNAMSRKELEKLKANVEKALEKVSARELKAAREAAEKAVAAHGFTFSDIVAMEAPKKRGPKPKTGPKVAASPKFRNPADATQTWTGKGRQPQWFKNALATGADPKTLEV